MCSGVSSASVARSGEMACGADDGSSDLSPAGTWVEQLARRLLLAEVGGDVQRRQTRLATHLAQVHVARGELVDELQVAVLGGDVDGGVAHLEGPGKDKDRY